MLNVGAIKEGFVLDHIKAGMSLSIYHDLKPVSYTHLDVYKRQVEIRAGCGRRVAGVGTGNE